MRVWLVISLLGLICVGCASSREPDPAIAEPASFREQPGEPLDLPELDARVVPPRGWKLDLSETTDRHTQSVWVSPTGGAAYGIIHFGLPLPVGEDIALRGFLAEMKKHEGEATLLSKNRDGERLRFVAEGGKYRIRGILRTRGFRGWAVYAGTLRGHDLAVDELELAVQARENTALGLGSD